jgi:hypothetical protein
MKKTKEIVGILVVVLITFCSCTNESVEIIQPQLLKKIVEVSVDGTSTITTLNYSGNKIQNIDKADAFLEFYYTGDEITKIIEFNKVSKQTNTLQYFYTEGKLIKITSSDNYVLNYIHNDDTTVSYEKVTKDAQNKDVKIHHGTLYFKNDNLIKDEQVLDNVEANILSKKSLNIVYDNKKNALYNIVGFSKLLDYSRSISTNNPLNCSETSYVKFIAEDRIISAVKLDKSISTYDNLGYPLEIVSENNIFGVHNSKHLKSQLFYN